LKERPCIFGCSINSKSLYNKDLGKKYSASRRKTAGLKKIQKKENFQKTP
jgi:hypothetical protein